MYPSDFLLDVLYKKRTIEFFCIDLYVDWCYYVFVPIKIYRYEVTRSLLRKDSAPRVQKEGIYFLYPIYD